MMLPLLPCIEREQMRLGIISFTSKGYQLGEHLQSLWEEEVILWDGKKQSKEETMDWIGKQFVEQRGLLFVGATGIAVRKIAPFLTDKYRDIPVWVVDEQGQHVIVLLSGHLGGGNEVGLQLAQILGAIPVITTATDLSSLFAIDLFAKKNGLAMINPKQVAKVSGKLLEQKKLLMYVSPLMQEGVPQEAWEHMPRELQITNEAIKADIVLKQTAETLEVREQSLLLEEKEYVLGMGCRQGKSKRELLAFLQEIGEKYQIDIKKIGVLCSIDKKAKEPGMLGLAQELHIPFLVKTKEELAQVKGEVTASAFVKEIMGVDNVCERSMLALGEPELEIVVPKQKKNGMTIAIGKRKWRWQCWE